MSDDSSEKKEKKRAKPSFAEFLGIKRRDVTEEVCVFIGVENVVQNEAAVKYRNSRDQKRKRHQHAVGISEKVFDIVHTQFTPF